MSTQTKNDVYKVEFVENPNLLDIDTSGNENIRRVMVAFNKEATEMARNFHKSFPQYEPTPLHNLKALAKELKLGGIFVKDESYRFGLNAFKVLGGSYAIARYIGQRLDLPPDKLNFEYLKSKEVKDRIGDVVFVTATDGNHGRGVAWAARELGQRSVVLLPKGSAQARLKAIRDEGAEAWITDVNYDDTVKMAKEYAREHNGVVIQDSVRPGYVEIPTWIMQGYTTIADEVMEQLDQPAPKEQLGQPAPKEKHDRLAPNEAQMQPLTHVFLQAGVGAFAGAQAAYFVNRFGANAPTITVVEPDEAACFFLSMKDGGKEAKIVDGLMPTMMAGLACGVPCDSSWEILKNYSKFFISCSDELAAEGMRTLARPLNGDPEVISGESGAVGAGFIKVLMTDDRFHKIKEQIGLNQNSRVLIISTEGATDPENYRRVVAAAK